MQRIIPRNKIFDHILSFCRKNRYHYFARMKEKRQRITKCKSKLLKAATKNNTKLEIFSKLKPTIPVQKSCCIVSSATIAKQQQGSSTDVYKEKTLRTYPI